MSKRLWLLGVLGLVLVGLLVACGSNYNRSQDGLLLVGSQGSALIQTYSFTLSNGHISSVANPPSDTANETCVLNGSPSSMVMNPSGAYAYVIFNSSSQCPNAKQPGIATFQVGSDGTVKQVGSLLPDPNPVALTMDSSGKFLFVAEGNNSMASSPNSTPCPQATPAQYGVCVYAVGSGGALTGVSGNFTFVNGTGFGNPNIVALAASPTSFPGIGINGSNASICSVPGNSPPSAEYLYAVDSINYVVWEFAVDMSTGALGNPPNTTVVPSFPTDKIPAGVAVDPCDRFVYVSDSLTNKISAYAMCMAVNPQCQFANGSLVAVPGSPFALSGNANQPGPIVVDPYGNNVYTVGVLSNTVSMLKIAPTSGALTALNPPVIAAGDHGMQPGAITIRGDDNWMFVSNYNAATVSQFSITPATGALAAAAPVQTDNYPWGVAVK